MRSEYGSPEACISFPYVCSELCYLLQEELSPETLMMKAIKGKGHYDSWRVVD